MESKREAPSEELSTNTLHRTFYSTYSITWSNHENKYMHSVEQIVLRTWDIILF